MLRQNHSFRSDSQHSGFITVLVRRPSLDTAQIAGAALSGLRAIYRPEYNMEKAGVMLLELQPNVVQQPELALEDDDLVDRGNLMATLDGPNLQYGRGTVSMASAGLAGNRRAWSMKQGRRTPGHTTDWTICRWRKRNFQLLLVVGTLSIYRHWAKKETAACRRKDHEVGLPPIGMELSS